MSLSENFEAAQTKAAAAGSALPGLLDLLKGANLEEVFGAPKLADPSALAPLELVDFGGLATAWKDADLGATATALKDSDPGIALTDADVGSWTALKDAFETTFPDIAGGAVTDAGRTSAVRADQDASGDGTEVAPDGEARTDARGAGIAHAFAGGPGRGRVEGPDADGGFSIYRDGPNDERVDPTYKIRTDSQGNVVEVRDGQPPHRVLAKPGRNGCTDIQVDPVTGDLTLQYGTPGTSGHRTEAWYPDRSKDVTNHRLNKTTSTNDENMVTAVTTPTGEARYEYDEKGMPDARKKLVVPSLAPDECRRLGLPYEHGNIDMHQPRDASFPNGIQMNRGPDGKITIVDQHGREIPELNPCKNAGVDKYGNMHLQVNETQINPATGQRIHGPGRPIHYMVRPSGEIVRVRETQGWQTASQPNSNTPPPRV